MIARPTTEQLLLDCARELLEFVLPAITDETAQVRLFMIEHVLRNAALRSAHELAWMNEEIPVLVAFAKEVAESIGTDADLDAAIDAADTELDSLHLDANVERYVRASEALSCAIEAAARHGDQGLVEAGRQLLEARIDRERVVMSGWGEVAAGR